VSHSGEPPTKVPAAAAAAVACSCRRDGRGLAQLLRELSALPGLHWMRILYAYPSYFDDELIQEIATNPKVGHRLGLARLGACGSLLP